MTDQIKIALKQLEKAKHIKILYAVESGSRAWGFASTNSDWDVRFIYIHPPEWYLSIDAGQEHIEAMLPNEIDLAGWELRKTLRLFRKSNPSLLEWLSSPMVYLEPYSTAEQLRALNKQYFNPKSCLYHYMHMAEGNYRQYLQKDRVKMKKYLYALRPILACRWIERTGTMAPMAFQELVDTQVTDHVLREAIDQLLKRKRSGEELDDLPRIPVIHNFVEQQIEHFNQILKEYDQAVKPATEQLDLLFCSTLKKVW